jgi:hypothetical protein
MHLIVDLGSPFDHRGAEGSAINRAIGSDLRFIVDLHGAGLEDLDLVLAIEDITETIRPNHSAAMEDHVLA